MEKQATFNFKNVMVYHHDDLDGYAAAAAVQSIRQTQNPCRLGNCYSR